MSGGVSFGAGGSSGGWSPLQAGAGLDPARGSAFPGYVERGSSGSGAWFAGFGVGRGAGCELGAGAGGDDGCWSAWWQSPCGAREEQWSSGGELGIDLPSGGGVADRGSALYRAGGVRVGGACDAVSMGLAGSFRSHTDGVSLRGVHRPGGQGTPWRSHPFRRDPLLQLTARC